jgi:hypothetical protein
MRDVELNRSNAELGSTPVESDWTITGIVPFEAPSTHPRCAPFRNRSRWMPISRNDGA